MRDRPRSVMMFAAGFGTRMGALTAARPKPLIEVGGRALIDHALDLVHSYRPEQIVANLHYLPEQIETHLAGQDVLFSHEAPEILETGGGLRAALPLLGPGPVFTMNTDAIWCGPNPLRFLAEHWPACEGDALLLCIPRDRAHGHAGKGDFVIDGSGRASRGPGHVYSGLQILRTDRLQAISKRIFSLNLVWDQLLADGRLSAIAYPGQWCDVGQPDSIALAENLLREANV